MDRVVDRNDNAIRLEYQDGRLSRIRDTAERTVRVKWNGSGSISAFELISNKRGAVQHQFAVFHYGSSGDLTSASDAEGNTTRFAYDNHRITSQAAPDSPVFYYKYDASGRCVETWGDFRPGVIRDLPDLLADGETQTRVLHVKIDYYDDGYREVIDTVRVRRFFANETGQLDKSVSGGNVTSREFDESGHLVVHEDANRAVTRIERDPLGRVLAVIDPHGHTTYYERNQLGYPIRVTDNLGAIMEGRYDMRGNLVQHVGALGEVTNYEYL